MRVRRATPSDASAIAEAHVGAWREAYAGILPDHVLENLSVDERAEAWCEILAGTDRTHRSGVLLLETTDSTVAGFTHFGPTRDDDAARDSGEIVAIYVRARFWRRGHGSTLLDAATEALGSAGFPEATLWVLETNTRARGFYESRGWELDGGRKNRPADGGGAELRYRLTLHNWHRTRASTRNRCP